MKTIRLCVATCGLFLLSQAGFAQYTLLYQTNGTSVTLTGYTGLPVNVTVSNFVTSIRDDAFWNCASLSSITIADSVGSIGNQVFYNCYDLTNVTLPDNITSIGFGLFQICTSLTNVTIPNSVTNIGGYAFSQCSSLSSVTIPNSVTFSGDFAFQGCPDLTCITVSAQNQNYSSTNGVLFNQDQTALVVYPNGLTGSYTVPNSVTSIEDYAFYGCSGLSSVIIPNSVTGIGESAFESCTSLSSISIPDSVTTIGAEAFSLCTNLTIVTIGNGVTSIGAEALDGCTRLTRVTIGNGVTTIGSYAFTGCPSLISAYFEGNAPSAQTVFSGTRGGIDPTTAYYLYGTTGWSMFSTNTRIPAVLLNPPIQTSSGGFGIQTNQFGFTITGPTNGTIVVQACTSLVNPVWVPLQTNILVNGSIYFSDLAWTNYPARFYRIQYPWP